MLDFVNLHSGFIFSPVTFTVCRSCFSHFLIVIVIIILSFTLHPVLVFMHSFSLSLSFLLTRDWQPMRWGLLDSGISLPLNERYFEPAETFGRNG